MHTYLTLFRLRVVLWKVIRVFTEVFSMADLFPLSVLLHFPPEVYLSRGVGDLCPLLVRAWHGKEISCIQFLRGGRVRVTVRDPAFREELLSSDFVFEGRKIPVTPAGVHTTTVYVRDLPVELSDEPCPPMVMSTPLVMRVSKIFLTCVMVTVSC